MLIQRILRYIIISVFLLSGALIKGQEKQESKAEERELRPLYVRIGVDPFSFVKSYIHPAEVYGITFQIDTELKRKYFPVAEIGNENFKIDNTNYKLQSNGFFVRLGVDNNFVKYLDVNDRDIFFAGLRYCFGAGSFDANDIFLQGAESPFSLESESYFVHWGELTAGVRTELFANIFLGWTIRLKKQLSLNDMDVKPYYIAGYGLEEKDLNVEMSAQIMYVIPYNKRKR